VSAVAGQRHAGEDGLFDYVLRLGDTSLVLAQRLGAWIGHAPAIEEDLGLANTALDLLGQARLFLAYAGEIEGAGRGEDELAYLREEGDFRNLALAEQPNGDFAETIVRQFLIDAYQTEVYERLQASADPRLAAIAAKAVKETRYHLRYSRGWFVRLGDGTVESHGRMERAVERLWKYSAEILTPDELESRLAVSGIAPEPDAIVAAWRTQVREAFAEATLELPRDPAYAWFGKQGRHTESLGHLLAEMQCLYRAHPGAAW
jgi:ring-1,2-phenylacetyl-CoA epoxidase subunit PaaC